LVQRPWLFRGFVQLLLKVMVMVLLVMVMVMVMVMVQLAENAVIRHHPS
jgi:hypothetical protein